MREAIRGLFKDISESVVDEILLMATLQRVRHGDLIFAEGEKPERLYVLIEGEVKVFKVNHKGDETILRFFHPVQFISELASLDNLPFPTSTKAQTDLRLATFEIESFKELMRAHIELYDFMLHSLCQKLHYHMNVTIAKNSDNEDSYSKIALLLLEDFTSFAQTKHWKIAQSINEAPETLSRVLRRFREEGAIGGVGKKISLLDRSKLKKYL